jgi:hypothetical protein
MVDPASGSTAGTQQQQQTTSQPPTLSITVVPLNVLDESLDGLDGGGGGVLGLDEDGDESIDGHRGSRRRILQPLSETSIQQLSQSIFDDTVDDVILGIVFEVHRGAKLGLTALLEEGIGGTKQLFFHQSLSIPSRASINLSLVVWYLKVIRRPNLTWTRRRAVPAAWTLVLTWIRK